MPERNLVEGDEPMSRQLRGYFLFTDIAMLAYWALIVIAAAELVSVPPEWMFSDHTNDDIVVWNWSFLPLDILLALFGLLAVRLARNNDPRWKSAAIVSLTLTSCAGLMALSFWAIRGDFDPSWWIANLYLLLSPIPFAWTIISATSAMREH
jgi:hypothetical protein